MPTRPILNGTWLEPGVHALRPIAVTRFTVTSCLGRGLEAHHDALTSGRSGLVHCDFDDVALDTWIGRVDGLDEPADRARSQPHACRNNQLAALAIAQDGFLDAARDAVTRYGESRVAVYLGTSTSGILETELAYRERDPSSGALPRWFCYRSSHNMFSLAKLVRGLVGAAGPAAIQSTACSSSAKVFASAARLIGCGLVDAAIVGGVDSLCLTTLYGFNSLEVLAKEPCRPFDAARQGISIGEGAAFALLEACDDGALLLSGYGESSDAHHMSSPHPQGLGARLAMTQALERAELSAQDIDYINLHGTATSANDTAEGLVVAELFGARTPASSTKGATGHALGAAGGIEAALCLLALRDGMIPGSVGTHGPDPAIPIRLELATRRAPLRHVLSNSLGFGGTNCSLVFSRRALGTSHGG